jgi:5-methyltetrahydropteroyltriglutamate--homocysteine methyltransferase
MTITANLGFPRIGQRRELKTLLEQYWKGDITAAELTEATAKIRELHWKLQHKAGIQHIPSNDSSLYDHVLDCALMLGVVPKRYQQHSLLDSYFAMARGSQGVPALEMTKWFDTNYHYIVPELAEETHLHLMSTKPIDEFIHAKKLGILTRPVLLGPISFLLLSKIRDHSNRWHLLPELLTVYKEVFNLLAKAGAEWIQIDEPFLVYDLHEEVKQMYQTVYTELAQSSSLKCLLTTYFGALDDNLPLMAHLPIAGLHIDLARAPSQLDEVCSTISKNVWLSLGIVNGRNIWKTDLEKAETLIKRAQTLHGDQLMIAPSCSLLHVPVDLESEKNLDADIKQWLAFAVQKCHEITLLADAANGHKAEHSFADNANAMQARRTSKRIHNERTQRALKSITPEMKKRKLPFKARALLQKAVLQLPLLPVTTIGSYPQTQEIRDRRAQFKRGEIEKIGYENFLRDQIIEVMKWQDSIGIDVPVHGEFERNDMVEYFGEQLAGFAFTEYGWVQSYGSRCVKPPIIYGDVYRSGPMTVYWTSFAQQQTKKPVKGMLTGPVTILQWSFVRDDQPVEETCRQIALAIREEVNDLENAGIRIIQIDEPALREGLPLRKTQWQTYLNWAVDSFLLASTNVKNETQIHTHMCYSEFNDIIESIAALDADVISIETSRSAMELLDAFVQFKYPNHIGPGVYDIHSPRVPNQAEMEALLTKALKVLSPEQLWVNPDCGLKTRRWEEVIPAITSMVAAALSLREKINANRLQKISE